MPLRRAWGGETLSSVPGKIAGERAKRGGGRDLTHSNSGVYIRRVRRAPFVKRESVGAGFRANRRLSDILSGDRYGLPNLCDRVVGVAPRKFLKLLVGGFPAGESEAQRCGAPFRRRLRQCGLRILTAPDRSAHAVDGKSVVPPTGHDHLDDARVDAFAEVDEIILGGGPQRPIFLRLASRQSIAIAKRIRRHRAHERQRRRRRPPLRVGAPVCYR